VAKRLHEVMHLMLVSCSESRLRRFQPKVQSYSSFP
jgi:hypothetical protein